MVDSLREQAQWRKGKTPLIVKYIDEHTKMFDEIAGRGFLALPGYAYDLENELELMTKLGLSDLNYKILSETIERELKQLGIDYGLAYRNAVMVWELNKQSMLTAWEAEYAGIKQGMMNDENVLSLLANEVKKRELTLMSSKLSIELSMEADKKALTQLDGTTAPYEIQLANAKMLTAQKKLDLIPILQEIVTKEQELLVIEQTKAAAYTTYMAAEQDLMAKKQTLVPYINSLSSITNIYVQDILNIEIPAIGLLSAEKVTQANISVQKAQYQLSEITIQIDTENKTLTLMDAKRALEIIQFTNEELLLSTDNNLTSTYHYDQVSIFETLLGEEQSTETNVLADRLNTHNIQLATNLKSVTTILTEDRYKDYETTQSEIIRMRQVAAYEAASKITAALNHIIG